MALLALAGGRVAHSSRGRAEEAPDLGELAAHLAPVVGGRCSTTDNPTTQGADAGR